MVETSKNERSRLSGIRCSGLFSKIDELLGLLAVPKKTLKLCNPAHSVNAHAKRLNSVVCDAFEEFLFRQQLRQEDLADCLQSDE